MLSYFVCCGVSCLVCYNVIVEVMIGDEGKVMYFEGILILISLVLVIVLVIVVGIDVIG